MRKRAIDIIPYKILDALYINLRKVPYKCYVPNAHDYKRHSDVFIQTVLFFKILFSTSSASVLYFLHYRGMGAITSCRHYCIKRICEKVWVSIVWFSSFQIFTPGGRNPCSRFYASPCLCADREESLMPCSSS